MAMRAVWSRPLGHDRDEGCSLPPTAGAPASPVTRGDLAVALLHDRQTVKEPRRANCQKPLRKPSEIRDLGNDLPIPHGHVSADSDGGATTRRPAMRTPLRL